MIMTVAIYRDTPAGLLRVGPFTVAGHPNGRTLAAAYFKRYPNDPGPVYAMERRRLFGRWCDYGERITLERE